MHLVPPDSPDSFSPDNFTDEDMAKMQSQAKEAMSRQSKTNPRLRERFMEIAEEAAELGVI